MGGRLDDFAVVESDPRIIYLGAAAGGLFKTVNGGQSWQPLFEDQPNPSIGDIALAPSNPAILYVGTGEANNRQSSSWGDGVYKSMDAGATWVHLGLKETHHIGRIVVHPTDPNIVYVAALGDLWGPNKERGVFMSTDGGAHWTQPLFVNEDTGVSDIAIDPQSPNILYAAAYQHRRTVFGYNGGGPGSGIYRSTDGGLHWTKLVGGASSTLGRGLPATGDLGRCALEVYRAQHQHRLRADRARDAGRRVPLRGQGRHLDAHERHQSAALLFQPAPHRPQQRSEDLAGRRQYVHVGRRRPHLRANALPRRAQRRARHLDRPRQFRPHAFGQRWRHLGDLGQRAQLGTHQQPGAGPVLRGLLRLSEALPRLRRAAGQLLVVRPQLVHAAHRHRQRGLDHGAGRRRILQPDRPRGSEHHLRRIAGRQPFAARPAHQRVEIHSAAGRQRPGPALSLPMELAADDFAARSEDHLLRRQSPVQIDRPRRHVGACWART